MYLAVVIDLWSRAVIGWSMSPRMTAQLTCDALQMALWRRKRPENVIVHTDRGGQYCSSDYQTLLKRHNLRGSMSAKGCLGPCPHYAGRINNKGHIGKANDIEIKLLVLGLLPLMTDL